MRRGEEIFLQKRALTNIHAYILDARASNEYVKIRQLVDAAKVYAQVVADILG